MAQKVRQTRLFAAEDYMAVYDSYLNANFKAFDFDTIRQSMVEYIRDNYPESFNDWVESSDFVALLDVVAQFGHNLAFRLDLNSRNNFLSTATRQDAVFKLAEFLGYQPRRNVPASGELKVISVKTNEDIIGSDGKTLAGKEIRYEVGNNYSNLDNFISVINAAFMQSNQFGNPRSEATILGSNVQFYSFNNTANQIVFEFSGVVQGTKRPFNSIGVEYDRVKKQIFESNPNPAKAFNIMYKNDGTGIMSNTSGFFIAFKQGSLGFKDFIIDKPISGMTLDIDVSNINQDDVWVQTISESGSVLKTWTKVDNVWGFNEVYNNIPGIVRDIFAVKTRENNQVSIMFSDESFGNLPKDIIRVWYRTGENASYSLRPDDVGSKRININYTGIDGNTYTLTLGIQLKVGVTNAAISESLDDIKQNAPRIYAAQDRMITADDYNNYLISQSTQIRKIKSINRTHSGHSRHITFNDPTGEYASVRLFATDGNIYRGDINSKSEAQQLSSFSIYENYIKPVLSDKEVVNLYYQKFKPRFIELKDSFVFTGYTWNTNDSVTGYFTNAAAEISGNNDPVKYTKYIQPGAMVKFTKDSNVYWAKISSIFANGLGIDNQIDEPSGFTVEGLGAIAIDSKVPNGATIDIIYPAFSRQFTVTEKNNIISAIDEREDFALTYDYESGNWLVDNAPVYSETQPSFFDSNDWVIYVKHTGSAADTTRFSYDVIYRQVRYAVYSDQIVFSNTSEEYKLDGYSKKKIKDTIDVFENGNMTNKFYVSGYQYDPNGVFYSHSALITLVDDDIDSRPDNPDAFDDITGGEESISNMRFEWTHVPTINELIDPSLTNIIDVFTLTNSYHTEFTNWLKSSNSDNTLAPLPPTLDTLNQQFYSATSKKSLSDTLIFRPVKYKVLFGNKATYDLRAVFKIVKIAGTIYTDNDIKSLTVNAIYEFFDSKYWDFGETFYFTELAAYVHKKLSGIISSFVIVPENEDSVFGTLFQITPMTDEMFIPDVSISDIEIIETITKENIKAIG
jgi:hypothetical protein